jgi:uncharacterized protein
VTALVDRVSYSLQRLVKAIPYKNAYHPKEALDVTQLATFEAPVTELPGAARDYLRMEFGASHETTIDQYRSSLRERARSGRSMPIRCTEYTLADDGTLTITADLAYDELFEDAATATQVTQQARLRSTDGTSGGSWRVLTPLTHSTPDCEVSKAPTTLEATIEDPEDTKHSPPVLVDQFDPDAGEVVLTALPHRFRQHGSSFRVDHCGWECPAGSNLAEPDSPPVDRDGYVADRPPVWVDTGEVFMLDPMVDDFGAPKADRALRTETIEHNPLWDQLQTIHQTGQLQPTTQIAAPDDIERFYEQMQASEACLTPNDAQRQFIKAVNHPLVPLQGPPGTGKTSGATAPALLARASARAQHNYPFTGIVVAPSHEAVDAILGGVVDCLKNWRAATSGLADLDLVRVTPTPPPADTARADADTSQVEVTYAAYHSDAGAETIREFATAMTQEEPAQRLLFATPATLYRVLGIVAETCSAIDGTSAPAAMRYAPGLADVVCLDEASMLDLPRLFLATSALKPDGQTLLVGDHRQLATVSDVDWTNTRRKPVVETGAYHSALEYVQELAVTADRVQRPATDGGLRQSVLARFVADDDSESTEDKQ